MISLLRHSVIAINQQNRIFIEHGNQISQNGICFVDFPLQLWMSGMKRMSCVVDTQNMNEEKIKLHPKKNRQVLMDILIIGIKISNISGVVGLLEIEILPKHIKPDIITIKKNCFIMSFELMQKTVFSYRFACEFFFGFEK